MEVTCQYIDRDVCRLEVTCQYIDRDVVQSHVISQLIKGRNCFKILYFPQILTVLLEDGPAASKHVVKRNKLACPEFILLPVMCWLFNRFQFVTVGRVSSVGIATRYGLDGTRTKSRLR